MQKTKTAGSRPRRVIAPNDGKRFVVGGAGMGFGALSLPNGVKLKNAPPGPYPLWRTWAPRRLMNGTVMQQWLCCFVQWGTARPILITATLKPRAKDWRWGWKEQTAYDLCLWMRRDHDEEPNRGN